MGPGYLLGHLRPGKPQPDQCLLQRILGPLPVSAGEQLAQVRVDATSEQGPNAGMTATGGEHRQGVAPAVPGVRR